MQQSFICLPYMKMQLMESSTSLRNILCRNEALILFFWLGFFNLFFLIIQTRHARRVAYDGCRKVPGFKIERSAAPGKIFLPGYVIVDTLKAVYSHCNHAPLQIKIVPYLTGLITSGSAAADLLRAGKDRRCQALPPEGGG